MDQSRCAKLVADDGRAVSFHRCRGRAIVTRDGRPYCGLHDPVDGRVAQARRAREAQWDAESAEDEAVQKEARRWGRRLGVRGAEAYFLVGFGARRSAYQRSLVISFDEAEKLVARLKK